MPVVYISEVNINGSNLKLNKGDLIPEPWCSKPYIEALIRNYGTNNIRELSLQEILRHLEREKELERENERLRLKVSNLEMRGLGLEEELNGAAPTEIVVRTGKKGQPRKIRISPKNKKDK